MPSTSRRAAAPARAALAAWAVPALLVLGTIALFGVRYGTNDDATIANIASGAYGPDRVHLVYVNILFGCLLRPLYFLREGVNWYVLAQLALLTASGAALCRLAMRRFGGAMGAALFCALALPFALELVYDLQYVKTAGVCLAAGLCWLAEHLGQGVRRCWPGLALALAGSLLRWDMFLAVGGLSAALLLARFFALRPAGRRRAAAVMALLFTLVFGAKWVDVLAYRLDAGWRAFTEYNAARMEFSDYKVYFLGEENPFAGQGISDTDYTMLRYWNFYDGTVFPAARLRALADRVPGKAPLQALRDTVRAGFAMLHGAAYRRAFALAMAGCLAALFLRRLRGARASRARALPFWGTLALFAAEIFYLMLRERLPDYVEIPLVAAVIVLCMAGVCGPAPADDVSARAAPGAATPGGKGLARRRGAVRRAAAALAALALAAVVCRRDWREIWTGNPDYWEWTRSERGYFEAMARDKDHLYLLTAEALTVGEGLDVWHPWEPGHYDNILFYGGWLSHAPHREAVLAAWGLTDPLTGAVGNGRVYLDYHYAGLAAQYAAEHLGVPVTAVSVGPNAFASYQLVPGE